MKKKIVNLMLMAAVCVAAGSLSSCKDYCEDDINELNGKVADLNAEITSLKTAQTACRTQCDQLKTELAEYLKKVEAEATYLKKTDAEATYLKKTDAEATYLKISEYNTKIAELEVADGNLNTAIQNLETAKTTLTTATETNAANITTLNGLVATAQARADEAYRLAAAAGTQETVNSLQTAITNLQTAVNQLGTTYVSYTSEAFTNLQTTAAAAAAKAGSNYELIEKLIAADNALDASIKTDSTRIKKLEDALVDYATVKENANKALEDAKTYVDQKIAAIPEGLTAAEVAQQIAEATATANEDIEALFDQNTEIVQHLVSLENQYRDLIDFLSGILDNLVTSVIVQGTYNQVFGEAAIPVGARTQVLAAFYGAASSTGVEFPTSKARYYVDPEAVALTYDDLERMGFDSRNAFTAEPGQVIMNAEGNAGTLYLTVNPNTIDADKVHFSLVDSRDNVSPIKLGQIYKTDHQLGFGWTRSAEDNGFYAVDATLLAADVKDAIPVLGGNAAEGLEKLNKIYKNGNYKRGALADAATEFFTTEGNVLPAYAVKATWYDGRGEHSVYSNYSLATTAFTPLSFAFMKDADYKTIPGYEAAIDHIQSIDTIKGPSDVTKNSIKSILIKYLDKVNVQICGFVNSINDYLQPTLLVNTGKNVVRVTTRKEGTDFKGTKADIYPTTYCGELFAPAFRKFVAVSNICDAEGQPVDDAEVKSFNEQNNLLQLINPTKTDVVRLEGLQAGYKYEIVYSAVDFSGKVVAKKYYLNVK